jgi:hypothetical protein
MCIHVPINVFHGIAFSKGAPVVPALLHCQTKTLGLLSASVPNTGGQAASGT